MRCTEKIAEGDAAMVIEEVDDRRSPPQTPLVVSEQQPRQASRFLRSRNRGLLHFSPSVAVLTESATNSPRCTDAEARHWQYSAFSQRRKRVEAVVLLDWF